MPSPSKVSGIKEYVPFVLDGDKIFPLKFWLLRPFPGQLNDDNKKVFN